VIGGAIAVGHLQAPAPEVADDARRHLVAGDREPRAVAQAARAGVSVGQGNQRMDGGPPWVRRQHVEAPRAGQMGNHGACAGLDRGRDVGNGGIGGRDHQQVHVARGAERIVGSTQGRKHAPTDGGQCSSQRGPGPPGADHPK
jgi:hypothetical protein